MFSLTVCVAGRGQHAAGQGRTLCLNQDQNSPVGKHPTTFFFNQQNSTVLLGAFFFLGGGGSLFDVWS